MQSDSERIFQKKSDDPILYGAVRIACKIYPTFKDTTDNIPDLYEVIFSQ